MIIKVSEIEEVFLQDFCREYKRFASFIDNGRVWNSFKKVVFSKKNLAGIIFCNNVMNIPPVKTHLMIDFSMQKSDLPEEERQAIGSLYGFLFKYVFQYEEQKRMTCRIGSIKSATLFKCKNLKDIILID